MDELQSIIYNQYMKKMALALDNGIDATIELGSDYIETMGMGIDRTVMHLSYFFEGYEDVYEKIMYENKRFLSMLKESVSGENPVKGAVNICFDLLLDNLDDNELTYLSVLMKESLHVAGFFATTGAVRAYLSTAVSELIYQAVLKNQIAKRFIGTGGNMAMAAIGGYGVIEIAAQAKERLKNSNADLYHSLHQRNLEMAYFLIEPNVSSELHMMGATKKSAPEVQRSINNIIHS